MSWLNKALGVLTGKNPSGPVNRVALILRPKQPVAEWVNACFPEHALPAEITLRNLEVILVDFEVEENLEDWLGLHWQLLFNWRLNAWYTDPDLWPQDRTLAMFREWFEVELADSVLDMGAVPFEVEDA